MKGQRKRLRAGNRQPTGRSRTASKSWYFVRLAFLAIPWESRFGGDPKGTLFIQYYLLEARNIKSAFDKARSILSVSEHCEGDGSLRGKRVIFKKVSILDIESLYEPIKSGVELFDESELGVKYAEVKRQVIGHQTERRMIAHEQAKGKPELFDICWGVDFDRL